VPAWCRCMHYCSQTDSHTDNSLIAYVVRRTLPSFGKLCCTSPAAAQAWVHTTPASIRHTRAPLVDAITVDYVIHCKSMERTDGDTPTGEHLQESRRADPKPYRSIAHTHPGDILRLLLFSSSLMPLPCLPYAAVRAGALAHITCDVKW
jgi:hypothetical protein